MTTTLPSSTSAPAPARLPAVIYVLTAGTFLMGTTEFVVAGLLFSVAGDFSVSVADAGLAITVFALGMIVGAPTMALATLRLPHRMTLSVALLVFAVGHAAGALTDDFGVLLATRFLSAVATGAFWAVATVAAVNSAGPRIRTHALGIVLGGGMLANVLGVPLGAFAGQLVGWRGTFWTLAVLAALLAAAVARTVPAGRAAATAPSIRAELASLGSGKLWLVLAACAAATGGVLSIYSFLSPILTEGAGVPESAVPLVLMGFGLAALVGSVIGGRLGDGHPYATPLVTAASTFLVALGLLAMSSSPVAVVVLFVLLGLVGLSANPVLVGLANRFGGEASTLATAMPTAIFNLGTAIGTALAGAALTTDLGARGPLLVGAVGAALVLVPLGTLALRERRGAQRA
ncbi:MFS transporter [Brachybacterium sacelli]|uniref:DHA1 family inner membrane transport protein n=1 Tax=Brachybacterium sacelli TaxID=173364 RepID=A0ABS4WYN2_9MICO|nr:MFS transporter [Brachybacterium sacelli]MBP2381258.1 DHA1 family inner membrane transport protein [Brachybacterium sacelli]